MRVYVMCCHKEAAQKTVVAFPITNIILDFEVYLADNVICPWFLFGFGLDFQSCHHYVYGYLKGAFWSFLEGVYLLVQAFLIFSQRLEVWLP